MACLQDLCQQSASWKSKSSLSSSLRSSGSDIKYTLSVHWAGSPWQHLRLVRRCRYGQMTLFLCGLWLTSKSKTGLNLPASRCSVDQFGVVLFVSVMNKWLDFPVCFSHYFIFMGVLQELQLFDPPQGYIGQPSIFKLAQRGAGELSRVCPTFCPPATPLRDSAV